MAGFAGARSVDDRRRRRLAGESEDASADATSTPAPRASRKTSRPLPARRSPAHFPLRKLVSRSLWKTWGVAFFGLAIGAGLLVTGWAAEVFPLPGGPGIHRLFNLAEAHLAKLYVTALVLICSQLAGLIGWMRSQSLRDFRGQYRGWALCAIAGILAVALLQTNLCLAWVETVVWFWPVSIPNRDYLCGLIPIVLFGSLSLRFMNREMRDCPASRSFLWLSAMSAGGLILLSLTQFQLQPLPARLVELGTMMLAALFLFVSLFLHTRHVMYCSVEPPVERPGLLSRAIKFALRSSITPEATPTRGTRTKTSRPKRKVARSRTAASTTSSKAAPAEKPSPAPERRPGSIATPIVAPRSAPSEPPQPQ